MKKRYDAFQQNNTDIYALSVDSPGQSRALAREMNLPFQLLCDSDKMVINRYHLLNPHEHGGIAYPALFVIRPDGEIRYRSLDNTAQRVDLTDVLDFLEKLTRDDKLTATDPPRKKWILPFPNHAWQISKNMLFRGTFADWKHYVTFPFSVTRMVWKKLFR